MLEQMVDKIDDKMLSMLNVMGLGFKSSYTKVDVSLDNHEILNLERKWRLYIQEVILEVIYVFI